MKTFYHLFRTSTLLFLFVALNSYSQENVIESEQSKIPANVLLEKIILSTDRTLYSINEEIQFKADYFNTSKDENLKWSTVLYVELIKPNGTAVAQYKFPLGNEGTSGIIDIPGKLLTGVYYLKAYTKWMRNFPTSQYAYSQIKLINPKKTNLQNNGEQSHQTDLLSFSEPKENNTISIKTSKQTYSPREKVEVSIDSKDRTAGFYTYSISVVKKGARNNNAIGTLEKSDDENEATYLPETNGISISGKVVDNTTQKPVEDAIVNLSLLNSKSYFSGFKTTDKGEFFFSFPYSEEIHEFFITTQKDSLDLDILVDNDFCQRSVHISKNRFELTEEERALAKEISINTQLLAKYYETKLLDSVKHDSVKFTFYGAPDKVLYTKKYIDLPNLEEFIFELMTEVTVIRKKKVPNIHPTTWNMFHNYPFLVMLDNIPILNISDFLRIKTNTVERIELINRSYVAGNMKYSGIISAFSKKQDFASIELPKNSMFFNYQMYSGTKKETTLEVNTVSERIPDLRNCLYWNPNPKIIPKSETKFSFKTSDMVGEYEIIVQSVSKDDNQVFLTKKSFVVE